MRKGYLVQGRMVAEGLNLWRVMALSGTMRDLSSPDYLRLKEQLSSVRSSNPKCRFLYLMGRGPDGAIFFMADSEPPASKDYSPPGQVYSEASAAHKQAFDTGADSVIGPVSDRWGRWITVLVPLKGPGGAKVAAVLGMDIDASSWRWELLQHILPFWLLLIFSSAIGFMYLLLRRSNASLQFRQSEIQAKEQRFREVLENSLSAAYKRDIQMDVYEYLSPVFSRISGYPHGEMARMSYKDVLELIHEQDRAGVESTIDRAARASAGDEFKVEYRFRHKDGVYRWFLDQFRVLRDGEGRLVARIGSISDITQMKQLSEAVRKERQRLSGIIRGTMVGTWEWNVQTGETLFNDRWAEIIGYSIEEIWPVSIKTWEKFVHPDDFKASWKQLERHFRGETEHYQIEVRMRHKNGGWVWVLDAGAVISWTEDGKPLMMMGTHQDITRQKLAEGVLRASEEKHRHLIEHSHDIIYTLSLDGVFTFVSPAWELLLGHDPAGVVGHHFSEFIHPEDVSGCAAWLEKALTTGERQEGCVYRVRHADGSWRWHTSSSVPLLDAEGRVCGVEGVARDITDHKQAEAALLQSQERLRQLAVTDELTGLYSRRGFFEMASNHFNVAKRYRKQLALLYCDVDGLRNINAELGHAAGDNALKDVARALKRLLRSSDIAARIGGDEFAVLLPEASEETALSTAERIRETVNSSALCSSKAICVNIGVREIDPDTMSNLDVFITQAQSNMRKKP